MAKNNVLNGGRAENWQLPALFLLCFAFFSFLMWCSPFTSDDYEFASYTFGGFGDIVSFSLRYGNGRLLGNIGVIFLVHSEVFSILVRALAITSIIFLLPKVLGVTRLSGYVLSFLLLTVMDAGLFGQVYSWISGFQNYIPPIWLTLLVISCIQLCGKTGKGTQVLLWVVIFLLGFASQLFVEHSSVVNVLLALCVALTSLKRERRSSAVPSWIWFVSTAIGLAVMFLIPVLFYEAGNRAEGYRSVNTGSLMQIIRSCVSNVMTMSGFASTITGVLAGSCALLTVHMTRKARSEKWNSALYGLGLVSLLYVLFNDILGDNSWYGEFATPRKLLTACFFLLPFCLWAFAALGFEQGRKKYLLLGSLAFGALSLAPLLFVSPTPVRTVYQAHLFFAAAVLVCFMLLEESLGETARRHTGRCLWITAAVAAVLIGSVFINIRWLDGIREKHILKKMEEGASAIDVFQIPYDYAHWDGVWAFERGYFYEEWKDIAYENTDVNTWLSEHYGELTEE